MKKPPTLDRCGARLPRPGAVTTATLLCWCAALFASPAPTLGAEASEKKVSSFRVGFSSDLFTEINENDAKASVKVWGQTIAKERGIPVDPEPKILNNADALLEALRMNLVDVFGITTIEYAALSREVRFAPVFVSRIAGQTTEQYLLLARHGSQIDSLADLRGRTLALHQHPRSCLAQPWLDTLLVQKGFKSASEFAGKVTKNSKLSKVVLPVFFGQGDACVVTRDGYETMRELNPQVGKRLKIIATSAELVPVVFCFRADYSPTFREQLLAGVRDLHKTPAGQQVLAVFMTDRLEDHPVSCLDSALELLATRDRLCSPTNGIAAQTANAELPPKGGGR